MLLIISLLGCSNQQSAQSVQGPGSETIAFAGQAVYPSGQPASGATVTARKQNYLCAMPDKQKPGGNDFGQTVTDHQGRFSIDVSDSGVYFIEIGDHNRQAGLIRCTTSAGRQALPEKMLTPTGTISGKVLSAGIGAPLFVRVYGMERLVGVDSVEGTFSIDDMPEGIFDLIVTSSDTSVQPQRIEGRRVKSDSTTNTGTIDMAAGVALEYVRELTLNTTLTGADISEDVINFPVLVRLTNDNFAFDQSASDGSDIRFTKSDGTALKHRIESFDSAREKAQIWVRADTVYADSETQLIRMHWGGARAGSVKSGNAFDTAAGFMGVYQFEYGPLDSLRDATQNGFCGIRGGLEIRESVEGIIGAGFEFDGVSDYFTLQNTATGRLDFPQDGAYTISAWVYPDSLDNSYHTILSKGDHRYGIQLHVTNTWEFYHFEKSSGWNAVRVPARSKEWALLTGVYEKGNMSFYLDGELVSQEIVVLDQEVSETTHDVSIGRMAENTARFFDGKMDEIRISSVARSSAWIKLCYMNQKPQDALLEFGTIMSKQRKYDDFSFMMQCRGDQTGGK